jgi:membrane dipeptidase
MQTTGKRRTPLGDGIVWDNHACMPLSADASFLPQLERYRKVGVNLVSLNVGMANQPLLQHLRVLSSMRRWIAQRADTYCLVSSAEDARRCKPQNRLGIVFDIEGMCPVQDDLSFVQTLYDLGVRWMLVAYNHNNKAGGGCLDTDTGLTAIGRAIIDEMERVGMVLCLSHTGAQTALEALHYARKPVIFSHSNSYTEWPHPRNISDDLMRACAQKGGVVGINGIGLFLGPSTNLVERLLRHVRYAVDLIGADHVGLSLDYVFNESEHQELIRCNPKLVPPGMDAAGAMAMIGPEAIPQIADGLAGRNLSDPQIRAILGENWLRIANRVWR